HLESDASRRGVLVGARYPRGQADRERSGYLGDRQEGRRRVLGTEDLRLHSPRQAKAARRSACRRSAALPRVEPGRFAYGSDSGGGASGDPEGADRGGEVPSAALEERWPRRYVHLAPDGCHLVTGGAGALQGRLVRQVGR